VRFIGNRSSGKQGHAIAEALARAGADVTLISGPVALPNPPGVNTVSVQTAAEMLAACEAAIPCDIAICAAAVSDWRPETVSAQKLKKTTNHKLQTVTLAENPDILKILSQHKKRPQLVIGFAAETEKLEAHARAKLASKGCDWILANNVSENPFGAETNRVLFLSHTDTQDWGLSSKTGLAERLVEKVANHLKTVIARKASA
jgi:phosphopantothenoylcysteine decarboxylase/phosphopantothenate--cysteine ligase